MNIKGSKHLTLEEREVIQQSLDIQTTRERISKLVSKDRKTISCEIKLRRNKVKNQRYGLYGKKDDEPCSKLDRYPFVCNACEKRKYCCKENKYFYDARIAQENYEIVLRDSRIGLDITLEDKAVLDATLKDGLAKGQSIHHIVKANKDKVRYSERNIYRLIDKGQTIVQAIDLRRKVKLKPRNHYVYKEDNKKIRQGRCYTDYISFVARHPNAMPVQIDTVESKSAGEHKCFLTVHFTAFRFMLVFLLEKKNKENVSAVFRRLRSRLGNENYKKLFPLILTDRGTEFCDPEVIEVDENTGELISRVFFCDSYSSYQKGAIEENHELIRCVVPKHTVFDHLTDLHAEILTSHIDSYFKKIINTTPYSLFEAYFGKDILATLNCHYIPPEEVNLTPSLLK